MEPDMTDLTYILVTNAFSGARKLVTCHKTRGFERLNKERNTWGVASARFVPEFEAAELMSMGVPVRK